MNVSNFYTIIEQFRNIHDKAFKLLRFSFLSKEVKKENYGNFFRCFFGQPKCLSKNVTTPGGRSCGLFRWPTTGQKWEEKICEAKTEKEKNKLLIKILEKQECWDVVDKKKWKKP